MEAVEIHRVLQIRSQTLQAIRRFFTDRGFLEVETPVRIPAPAQELHIDAEISGGWFLRTSPELHMKRLLADGMEKVFQIGPCFRSGERGRLHSPEFSMLEWYRRGADYLDMLVDTKALMNFVLESVLRTTEIRFRGQRISVMPVWECLSVADVFVLYAGWNPVGAYDGDRFDLDLVEKVEPRLPADRPVVLKDYPAEAAALARCRPGPPRVAERWELYIGGMELANAFSELTDPREQRARFVECGERRRRAGKAEYPLDEAFLSAMERGLPISGGVALGVDRLIMLLTDAESIGQVRPCTP